jgi:hypothetical protein
VALRTPAPKTFEIGLVMAGAASAGAYTAGVVDFLLEALQAWEEAKASGDPGVPDHDVRIRVAAGASAGGVVASLLAMLSFTGHFPMRDLARVAAPADAENATRNLLYKSWVSDIDIRRMLAIDDLQARNGVPSLLNGEVLADCADSAVATVRAALASPGAATPPRYLANPLQLYLCLTNMRGLPYEVRMVADEALRGHRVKCHADYGLFAVFGAGVGEPEPFIRGAIPVNWPGTVGVPTADGWSRLRDAALATSAFPGGFPARAFRNPFSTYRARPCIGPATQDGASVSLCLALPHADDEDYDFWCVDGGLLDNEPLGFARAALLGSSEGHLPRDPKCADRAVLLIDPFPNDLELLTSPFGGAPDLLDAVFALIPMLRAHAAFKPHDLMLAMQDDVRSRFLIAPMREQAREGEGDLACGGLAGFAGFVHERLRLHDFQLGRRNCQKFLQDHFSVRADNPVVRGWVESLRQEPGALDRYHPMHNGGETLDRDMVQVIPLMASVRAEVGVIPWPKLDQKNDFDPLKRLIERRADAIVPALIRTLLRRFGIGDPRLVNRALRAIATDVITNKVGKSAALAIERDLIARSLL